MTIETFVQVGALVVAAATLGLNYSDMRHRREMRELVHRVPTPEQPLAADETDAPSAPMASAPTPTPMRVDAPWGLPRRVISHFIDVYAPLLPVMIVSSYAVDEFGDPLPGHEATWGAVQILFWGLVATQVIASGLTGRTIGRLIMGGRLVDASSGEPIGILRVLGHAASFWLLWGVPALGVYRSKARRGWHDDWARGRFVSTRAPATATVTPLPATWSASTTGG